MNVIAFDTETFQIGPGALAPKIVCASLAYREGDGITTRLIGNHPEEDLEGFLRVLLTDEDTLVVTHSGGFDYCVLVANFPDLIPLIFDALLAGRCTDTEWREKLLNLSTTGKLEKVPMPDGSLMQLTYGLAELESLYLGHDREAEKKDLEESWRANYSALDGYHSKDYPEDAAKYAVDDASGTLEVYEAQERRKVEWKMSSTATEHIQLAAQFALRLMSCWGMEVNQEAVAVMREEVEHRLSEVVGGLIEAGLLRPAIPSAPYKRQMKKVAEWIRHNCTHARDEGWTIEGITDWSQYREGLEAAGISFTEGKASSVNEAAVQAYVGGLYARLGEIPAMTAGGESAEPQIKLDAEVQEYLATKDPLMDLYHRKQSIKKIVDQLVIFASGPVIHPNYNALVETGRTSSYGSSKRHVALYPSCNIQNVPNEKDDLDPRRCYKPRTGTVFFDCDFTGLELACTGQITYDLFGESVHFQRYNEGVDLHGYLGAQLAIEFGTDGLAKEFAQECRTEGILSDPMAVYLALMECKKDPKLEAFVKEWRDFAKPTGLGFPGGLGPETMVEYARKTYGVTMTERQAHDFREIWRSTYPEMPRFHDWITSQLDEYNVVSESGEQLYWYETPLGMIRRGATFCAATNGKSMQSPGAEGAKIAVINVQRACYDPTQESVLYGCRPIAFVHDQIVGETTKDESIWHEQCMEVRRIMCDSMKHVLPGITMRSDEAHLTSVWTKKSKPTFGPDNRLIPWTPKKAA